MKVVELPVKDVKHALEALDTLRAQIESGELKAFIAVGIAQNHETYRWQASTSPTTQLELAGAVATLAHWVQGEVS